MLEIDIAFVIQVLRNAGLRLYVENGVARGEMKNGGRIPFSVMHFVNQYHAANAEAVQFLTRENDESGKVVKLQNADILTAKAVKRAIDAGVITLVGRLIYHKKTNRIDITFQPNGPAFDLGPYREAAITNIKEQMSTIEKKLEEVIKQHTVQGWNEQVWNVGKAEREALEWEYARLHGLLVDGGAA